MNIYAIESYGDTGCGIAIVAAKSEAEAIKTAQDDVKNSMWGVTFQTQSRVVSLLTHIVAEPGLLHFYETGE
jgi:hypothetical protein